MKLLGSHFNAFMLRHCVLLVTKSNISKRGILSSLIASRLYFYIAAALVDLLESVLHRVSLNSVSVQVTIVYALSSFFQRLMRDMSLVVASLSFSN